MIRPSLSLIVQAKVGMRGVRRHWVGEQGEKDGCEMQDFYEQALLVVVRLIYVRDVSKRSVAADTPRAIFGHLTSSSPRLVRDHALLRHAMHFVFRMAKTIYEYFSVMTGHQRKSSHTVTTEIALAGQQYGLTHRH
jgi:hypothetical protein